MHHCEGYISTEAKPNTSLGSAVYETSAKDLKFTFERKVNKVQMISLFGQYSWLLRRRFHVTVSKQRSPVFKFDASRSQTNVL
jgi:hypothetical protein